MNAPTRRIAAAAATAIALAATLAPRADAAPSASADDSRTAVCAGVDNCHRVAVIDVDGDHRADRVGWRRLSDDQVQIRVSTADGELRRNRVDVRYWPGGGVWGDAAWIDGRPGAELLVGSVMGAHTPQYTMLTYRDGHLVVEKSPGGRIVQGRWTIDAALMVYAGWDRAVGPGGRVTITKRDAWRNEGGTGFTGHDVRYAWQHGGWQRVDRSRHSYAGEKRARRIAGWHVGHLQRWPGLRR